MKDEAAIRGSDESLIDLYDGLTTAPCSPGLVKPMTCYTVLPKLPILPVYHHIISTAVHTLSAVCHPEQRMIGICCRRYAWTAEQLEH